MAPKKASSNARTNKVIKQKKIQTATGWRRSMLSRTEVKSKNK